MPPNLIVGPVQAAYFLGVPLVRFTEARSRWPIKGESTSEITTETGAVRETPCWPVHELNAWAKSHLAPPTPVDDPLWIQLHIRPPWHDSRRDRLIRENFLARVQYKPGPGCWLWWGGLKREGQHVSQVFGNGRKTALSYACRLLAMPVQGYSALCEKSPMRCIHPLHRQVSASRMNPRVLRPEQVRAIRELMLKGERPGLIAERFNVSYSTVYRIATGITYTEIQPS